MNKAIGLEGSISLNKLILLNHFYWVKGIALFHAILLDEIKNFEICKTYVASSYAFLQNICNVLVCKCGRVFMQMCLTECIIL